MSAPRKAYTLQSVKIRPKERLATTSELNPAPGGVTCHRGARGMGYWATTQVKGLSPEITIVSEVETVHEVEDNSLIVVKRDGENPTGSKTVAWYQRECVGTWETQCIPERVCDDKPENGKKSQMMHWESDQLIVVMKSRQRRDGAKGLAGKPWNGDTSSVLRDGQRESTKPIFVTHLSDGEEVFLKSPEVSGEICTSGSVRGFIVNSERRWL